MKPPRLSPESLAAQVVLGDPEQDLDPSTRAWLRRGFASYLQDPEQGLERALGLRVRTWARGHRDAAIRRAAGHLRGSTFDKARTLATWASDRAKAPTWPGKAGEQFRLAMGYGRGRLPRSERQYLRIIERR